MFVRIGLIVSALLVALNGFTSLTIDVSDVAKVSGTFADVNDVYVTNAAQYVGLGDEAVTLSGSTSVSDANSVSGSTTGIVTATIAEGGMTSLNGLSTDGQVNAYTSFNRTVYWIDGLSEHLDGYIDVLADMITSATIAPADVDQERSVVLEEISMRDDDPSDLVHEHFARAMFGDAPLGRSVLGTVENIESLSRRSIHGFYRKYYTADRLVIAVAGNVDHATIVRLFRKALTRGGMTLDGDAVPYSAPRSRVRIARDGGFAKYDKVTEQANVVIGVPGLDRSDERRYQLTVLNAALGGGMSSRLFQEVREKRGLVYSVYSFAQQFADTGVVGVYAGCQPKRLDAVRRCTAAIVDGLDDDILTRLQALHDVDPAPGLLARGDLERQHRIAQHGIALGMAILVVQRLEVVEIREQDSHPLGILTGRPQCTLNGLHHRRAIGQRGQRISRGKIGKSTPGCGLLGDIDYLLGEQHQ